MSRLSEPWKELQHCVQSYTIEKAPKELLVSGLRREGYGDFKGKFYEPHDLTQPIAVDTVARKIAGYLRRPKPFREIKDYEARKEAKRSKLTSALLQDDPAEAKKQLTTYLVFLEENPLINTSNRHYDDYALPPKFSLVLTFIFPLLIAIFGLTTFMGVLGVTGVLAGGLDGILITIMHWKARTLGERKPEYQVRGHLFIKIGLVVMFVAGIVYQLKITLGI